MFGATIMTGRADNLFIRGKGQIVGFFHPGGDGYLYRMHKILAPVAAGAKHEDVSAIYEVYRLSFRRLGRMTPVTEPAIPVRIYLGGLGPDKIFFQVMNCIFRAVRFVTIGTVFC